MTNHQIKYFKSHPEFSKKEYWIKSRAASVDIFKKWWDVRKYSKNRAFLRALINQMREQDLMIAILAT